MPEISDFNLRKSVENKSIEESDEAKARPKKPKSK